MSEKEIYFDNNATTRPLPQVRDEVLRVIGEEFGNPSSAHGTGERARGFITSARAELGELIGCSPNQLTFTSSGTESNNMAFYSCTRDRNAKTRLITTTVEHSSIQKMCNYLRLHDIDIKHIGVDSKGIVDMDELEREIKMGAALVSVQWVNNETGVVQPLVEIGEICIENEVPLHTDAAQAIGKIELNVDESPACFLSLTGHKFHSPQGIGAIYSREKVQLTPIMFGGFQEEGFRPGTENVPGIVGLGKAAQLRGEKLAQCISHMEQIRDKFEQSVLESIPGAMVNGDISNRICNTSNILFKGYDGRKLIKELDNAGVRCSQSSACTNFEMAPSYVLRAMGLTEQDAYSSIRFSFSVENTFDEVERVFDLLKIISPRIRN